MIFMMYSFSLLIYLSQALLLLSNPFTRMFLGTRLRGVLSGLYFSVLTWTFPFL